MSQKRKRQTSQSEELLSHITEFFHASSADSKLLLTIVVRLQSIYSETACVQGYSGFDQKLASLRARFQNVDGFGDLLTHLERIKQEHNSEITREDCAEVQKRLNGGLKTLLETGVNPDNKRRRRERYQPPPRQQTAQRKQPTTAQTNQAQYEKSSDGYAPILSSYKSVNVGTPVTFVFELLYTKSGSTQSRFVYVRFPFRDLYVWDQQRDWSGVLKTLSASSMVRELVAEGYSWHLSPKAPWLAGGVVGSREDSINIQNEAIIVTFTLEFQRDWSDKQVGSVNMMFADKEEFAYYISTGGIIGQTFRTSTILERMYGNMTMTSWNYHVTVEEYKIQAYKSDVRIDYVAEAIMHKEREQQIIRRRQEEERREREKRDRDYAEFVAKEEAKDIKREVRAKETSEAVYGPWIQGRNGGVYRMVNGKKKYQ